MRLLAAASRAAFSRLVPGVPSSEIAERARPPRAGRAALAAWALAAALGCAREQSKGPAVLLIGVDGLDPGQVATRVQAGTLPNLRALIERGTFVPLATFSNHSEEIWTTIATGVSPDRHGIQVRYLNRKPYNSTMRKVPALWNILTHYGRRVAVLGWWVTFPAEPVNGYVVSPYLTFEPRTAPSPAWNGPGRTHPPELERSVAPLLLREEDVPEREAARFAGPPGEMRLARWAIANDTSYHRIAQYLLARDPTLDLFAVYYRGVDIVSHDYTRWVYGVIFPKPVSPPPQRVSDAERATALRAVDAIYEKTDALVGELMRGLPPETTVLVVSDHGWSYDGTEHWNHNPGVLIAAGGPIRHGARVEGARVFDIAPTILALLRLPVSSELEGVVLEGLFDPGRVPAPERVARYDFGSSSTPVETTPYDAEAHERLRALGYVE
jgi:predicted AlkP superfamily phosphohydrolase/phosphomutase